MNIATSPEINVIYIAGHGRSGSTLLDCLLGQVPELFSLGEVRFSWHQGFIENHLCACGQPFHECNFWTSVVKSSEFIDEKKILDFAEHVARLDKVRTIPQFLRFSKAADSYNLLMEEVITFSKLYQTIAKVSGSSWLIDSSKTAWYAYLLHNVPGIKLHVVHLIRDARAVAYSRQRKKVLKGAPSENKYMATFSSSNTAKWWNYDNLAAQSLRHISDTYIRVRYEDLIQDPKAQISRILERIGFKDGINLNFLDGNTAYLKSSHIVYGNPSRFQQGATTLCLDDEWKRNMPAKHYFTVTLTALPLLILYGYSM